MAGKQKIVVKVSMVDAKKRSKALKIAVGLPGVTSAALDGDRIVVVGDVIDSVTLTLVLRKRMGFAELVSVGTETEETEAEETTEEEEEEEENNTEENAAVWQPAVYPCHVWPPYQGQPVTIHDNYHCDPIIVRNNCHCYPDCSIIGYYAFLSLIFIMIYVMKVLG